MEKCHPIRMMRIVVVLDLLWEVEKLLVPALRLWLLLVILEIQLVGQPTLLGTGFKGGRDETDRSFIPRQGSAYETSGMCDMGLIGNNMSNIVDVLQHMTEVPPTAESLNFLNSTIAVDIGSLCNVVDPEVAEKILEAVAIWKQTNSAHGFYEVDVMSLLILLLGSNNALTAMLAHAGLAGREELDVFNNALSDEQRNNASASLKAKIATADQIQPDQEHRCEIVKLQMEQRFESLYEHGVKFVILPTCNKVAQPVSWWRRRFDSSDPKLTFQYSQVSSYANMCRLPRATIPIGHPHGNNGNDHMPTSLSIMATSNKVDPWELIAVGRELELICRQHDNLKLNQPEFYIHEQLAESRDRRRAQQV